MNNSIFGSNGNSSNTGQNEMGYPEMIYTTSYKQNHNFVPSQGQNAFGGFGNLLNSDLLKSILPLLLKKNNDSGGNFLDLLKNANPNISSIISSLSQFGGNKKSQQKDNNKKNGQEDIIDITGYTEIE